MARAQDLQRAINDVSGHEGPMLSAYLSVNAAIPENQGQAYLVRLKDALGDLEVPEEVAGRVRDVLDAERHPRARTVAVFAAEDGLMEVYRLPVDLPEAYRWGEPYTAPLLLALNEYEPYGVALVDAERFRYFVTSPVAPPPDSDEHVGASGYREVDLDPSAPYPRGGMDQEPTSRRTEANVHKFFNELAGITRDVTFREGVKRLILAGTRERTSEFRKQLPNEIQALIVSEEPVNLGDSEGNILDGLEEVRQRDEHERETVLLAEVRESGVSGLDDTVKALQEENRVYHLLILWNLEGEVRWSDEDGLAIMDITQEESPFSGAPTRVRPLIDVLVDLAVARGARVTFLRGENENTDTLRDEFGGLAGLTRF